MPNILDKEFRYTPSAQTDIRKTFAKARKLIVEQKQAQASADAEAKAKVATIEHRRKS
jgi:hypothetical protein